ncbi:MAG: peptide deformylase [Patescibacteria group bacterium]|jgi:peptide deformylase|nr:peptide deformylase [Patescibacteria group bacterium]
MTPVKHKDPIVQEGAPVLRAHAKPVLKKEFGSTKLRKLLRHMSDVLAKEEYGVALAAPQVGEQLRIFVVAGKVFKEEGSEDPTQPDMAFINPEIIRLSRKKKEMSEGCLSVRGKYGTVLRHEKASVKAFDAEGKPFTYHGAGLVAHIFQHECDHLDGILYTDKAESMRPETKDEA